MKSLLAGLWTISKAASLENWWFHSRLRRLRILSRARPARAELTRTSASKNHPAKLRRVYSQVDHVFPGQMDPFDGNRLQSLATDYISKFRACHKISSTLLRGIATWCWNETLLMMLPSAVITPVAAFSLFIINLYGDFVIIPYFQWIWMSLTIRRYVPDTCNRRVTVGNDRCYLCQVHKFLQNFSPLLTWSLILPAWYQNGMASSARPTFTSSLIDVWSFVLRFFRFFELVHGIFRGPYVCF